MCPVVSSRKTSGHTAEAAEAEAAAGVALAAGAPTEANDEAPWNQWPMTSSTPQSKPILGASGAMRSWWSQLKGCSPLGRSWRSGAFQKERPGLTMTFVKLATETLFGERMWRRQETHKLRSAHRLNSFKKHFCRNFQKTIWWSQPPADRPKLAEALRSIGEVCRLQRTHYEAVPKFQDEMVTSGRPRSVQAKAGKPSGKAIGQRSLAATFWVLLHGSVYLRKNCLSNLFSESLCLSFVCFIHLCAGHLLIIIGKCREKTSPTHSPTHWPSDSWIRSRSRASLPAASSDLPLGMPFKLCY